MHSKIIQFAKTKEELGWTDIPEWFYNSIADYFDIISDYRDDNCGRNLEYERNILQMFNGEFHTTNESIVFTKKGIESWFKRKFDEFKEKTSALSFDDFVCGRNIYSIKASLEENYSFYVINALNSFSTLDEFLRCVYVYDLEKTDSVTYYIGDIYDYHF